MFSWNKLPIEVKISSSLNVFKSNLEIFKRKTIALGGCYSGNFWEISDEVFVGILVRCFVFCRTNFPRSNQLSFLAMTD